MNAEQKQRALTLLDIWYSINDSSQREYQAAELIAALLQELVCAPEAEPFAVIHLDGSFVHVEFKQTIAGTGKFEVYAAPPAPSVPDSVASEPVGYLYTNLQSGEYHVSDYDDDYRGPERALWHIEPVYRRTKGQS